MRVQFEVGAAGGALPSLISCLTGEAREQHSHETNASIFLSSGERRAASRMSSRVMILGVRRLRGGYARIDSGRHARNSCQSYFASNLSKSLPSKSLCGGLPSCSI